MKETRYLLQLDKNQVKSVKNHSTYEDTHENWYFKNFRLRKTAYKEDHGKIRYFLIPSSLGTSQAVKQKTELSESKFKKLKENHKNDFIFYQRAVFYHPRGTTIMIEHDFVEPRNQKPFEFWSTEAEDHADQQAVEQFLKANNIKYEKTLDNLRTIIEKIIKKGNQKMREYIIQEALKEHSIIKRTREQKINAAAASLAVQLAKQNNDPMYQKLSKYRALMLEARKKIMQKYYNRAKTIVRQRLGSE